MQLCSTRPALASLSVHLLRTPPSFRTTLQHSSISSCKPLFRLSYAEASYRGKRPPNPFDANIDHIFLTCYNYGSNFKAIFPVFEECQANDLASPQTWTLWWMTKKFSFEPLYSMTMFFCQNIFKICTLLSPCLSIFSVHVIIIIMFVRKNDEYFSNDYNVVVSFCVPLIVFACYQRKHHTYDIQSIT